VFSTAPVKGSIHLHSTSGGGACSWFSHCVLALVCLVTGPACVANLIDRETESHVIGEEWSQAEEGVLVFEGLHFDSGVVRGKLLSRDREQAYQVVENVTKVPSKYTYSSGASKGETVPVGVADLGFLIQAPTMILSQLPGLPPHENILSVHSWKTVATHEKREPVEGKTRDITRPVAGRPLQWKLELPDGNRSGVVETGTDGSWKLSLWEFRDDLLTQLDLAPSMRFEIVDPSSGLRDVGIFSMLEVGESMQ